MPSPLLGVTILWPIVDLRYSLKVNFLDYLRKVRSALKEGAAEQRAKRQLDAFRASSPTDLYVTLRISGDGELQEMTRVGWEVVAMVSDSEYAFSREYLMRMRRGELAEMLGLDI